MKTVILSFLGVALVFFASGCGVGDFIGAYFNTYYNAQRLFAEAEDEVLSTADTRESAKMFLAPFVVQPNTKTKFESVIEKCSKLLQYHPDSKLVDDALLMIGKSYYYQNEHQRAERKFKELLDAYPSSDLALETRLLLANTYYKMNDKEQAGAVAKELLENATAEEADEITGKSAMLLAQLAVESKDFEAAASYYATAADHFGGTERSKAYRSVAEMFAKQGEYQKAATAYKNAEDASTDYIGEYQSRIGLARMLANLGKYEASLAELEDLLSDTNNRDFYGEINLEIANVYRAQGDLPSAIAQYNYVDTAYVRTESSAKSYYALGQIYENQLLQYDSARVMYNKGRNEASQAPVTVDLVHKGDLFNKYGTYTADIARYDSLKQVLLAPPDTTEKARAQDSSIAGSLPDSSTGLEIAPSDSLSVTELASPEDSLLEHQGGMQPDSSLASMPGAPVDSLGGLGDTIQTATPQPVVPAMSLDTLNARLAKAEVELAGLFYTGLENADSAEVWYRRLLIEHPSSPYVPRALFTLAQIYSQDSSKPASTIDSLRREVLDRFPESEFAAESRRLLGLPPIKITKDEAEVLYQQAEHLVQAGNSSAAIDSFRSIVHQYPESPYASKAQFAVGWVFEEVRTEPDSAINSYKKLVDQYPSSEYAAAVRGKLAAVQLEEKAKERKEAPPDSSAGAGKPILPPNLKGNPEPIPPDSLHNQKEILQQEGGEGKEGDDVPREEEQQKPPP